jgi:hypothetical protein
MADSPVQVHERDETVIGQPQSRVPAPHDGATVIKEIVVHTDRQILDPNDPLAVQIPEGVGASTYGHVSPLGSSLKLGTAEEQFAAEAKSNDEASADNKSASDDKGSPKTDAKK